VPSEVCRHAWSPQSRAGGPPEPAPLAR